MKYFMPLRINILGIAEMIYQKLKQYTLLLLLLAAMQVSMPAWAKGNDVAQAENRVISVTRNIVKDLEQNKARYQGNPAAFNAMVRQRVLPFIDFDAMAKLTLGKHWRTASPVQRKRFINAYREMLIRSYGKAMFKYAGATIKPGNSAAKSKPGYVTVRTQVIPKGGKAIAANYDVRKKGNDWKAYNVEIAGINLLTNFRTNFTREVSAKGLDALIARLEKTRK